MRQWVDAGNRIPVHPWQGHANVKKEQIRATWLSFAEGIVQQPVVAETLSSILRGKSRRQASRLALHQANFQKNDWEGQAPWAPGKRPTTLRKEPILSPEQQAKDAAVYASTGLKIYPKRKTGG